MNKIFYLPFFISVFFFQNCTSAPNYKFGLFTNKTYGQISFEKEPTDKDIILLVVQYNKTFIELGSSYLEESKAKVFQLTSSRSYSVSMPNEIHRQVIYVLAAGYKMERVETTSVLGVGAEEYNIRLATDPAWPESFIFHIKPFLTSHIERYKARMTPKDLSVIYDWLEKNERAVFESSNQAS